MTLIALEDGPSKSLSLPNPMGQKLVCDGRMKTCPTQARQCIHTVT